MTLQRLKAQRTSGWTWAVLITRSVLRSRSVSQGRESHPKTRGKVVMSLGMVEGRQAGRKDSSVMVNLGSPSD